jgi:CheY-like chemotaxis protein
MDLRAIVDTTVTLAAHEIRRRAQLSCHLDELPPVLGREQALRQVFLHLLINAAQAMPDDATDRNRVEVRSRTDAAGNAVVEIDDTGPGIPAVALGRIFEPFFTTRPPGQGLGLGLSVCLELVTAMGGRIAVESEAGRGTRVRVVLPPAPPVPREVAAPPRPSRVASARRRFLIIDDDRPVAAAVALELAEDHDVVVAGSGREALEILRRDPAFDVVLCDLMMPEMSGMELFAWLQPIEPELAGRIVFMTGGVFTPRAEHFLRETTNVRLDKPFRSADLRRVIEGVAPRHGHGRLGPYAGFEHPRAIGHPVRSRAPTHHHHRGIMDTIDPETNVPGNSTGEATPTDGLGARVHTMIDGARDRVTGAGHRVAEAATRARSFAGDNVDSLGGVMGRHPLVTIALGLGLGYFLGRMMARR